MATKALALAAGELVQEAVGEIGEGEVVERTCDLGGFLFVRPAPGMGIAAEGDEIAYGQAGGHVVVLPQDGEAAGELVARRRHDIEPVDRHVPGVHAAINSGEIFPPFVNKQKEVGVKYDFGTFALATSLFEIR